MRCSAIHSNAIVLPSMLSRLPGADMSRLGGEPRDEKTIARTAAPVVYPCCRRSTRRTPYVQRYPPGAADAGAHCRLLARLQRGAGAWHRGEYADLQRDQPWPAPAAAVSGSG